MDMAIYTRRLSTGRGASSRARARRAPTQRPGLGGRSSARSDGQLHFGITQGGTDPDLRTRSIGEISALQFDGYALGGLAVEKVEYDMLECVESAAPLLPLDRPRYFMGIGDPEGILEVVTRGSTCSTASCPRERRKRARR